LVISLWKEEARHASAWEEEKGEDDECCEEGRDLGGKINKLACPRCCAEEGRKLRGREGREGARPGPAAGRKEKESVFFAARPSERKESRRK